MHRCVFCQIVIPLPKAICRVFSEMHCVTMSAMPKTRCALLPEFSVVAVSGRSLRSTLMLMKCSFIRRALPGFSNDSYAMT